MPELRQLRYFIAVAETLHFGRAAERLHITQPPLSRQIAELEAELGTPLLQRNSRSVQLTAAGRSFYQHAREVLAALDLAMRTARAVGKGETGELCIGFTMVAAWSLLPRLLGQYRQRFPQVAVKLEEIVPRDLEQALTSGRVDIGISFPAASGSRLHYRRLQDEPLCVVLPAGHPLAACATLDITQLANEDFISFPASTAPALHAAIHGHCRAHGFTPRVRLETHLQQTIVNLVAEGLGIALVPDAMRRMQLPGAVFRPLQDAPRIEQGVFWSGGNDNPCVVGVVGPAAVAGI